jgi:predicted esterase
VIIRSRSDSSCLRDAEQNLNLMIEQALKISSRSMLSSMITLALLTLFADCRGYSQVTAGLPAPGSIGDVQCALDATLSYSLYLPKAYAATKAWPIIYFFDPGGRGRRPLDLYQEIAETYGFILAGSNNSRNFSSDQSKSVNAIWQDTHVRLALDAHRVYSSGFSGGARVAGAMALGCPQCQIAGVIANGAGYPSNRSGGGDKLLYFFAVGNQDFNWPEVMNVRREREDQGLSYRVRVFEGTHQWSPAPVMEDAMQWLNLRAMQNGSLPQDQAFIDKFFQQRKSEASDAEQKKDALAELDAYRSLVSDFAGLRDTSGVSRKLEALKQSDGLKAALKSERDQIEEQFALERDIAAKLRDYERGSVADPNTLRTQILQAISGLKDQAAHAKNESKRLVSGRAIEDLWVEGIENGQQELEAKHFDRAEACFELMSQVKSEPWPSLLLARTHLAWGKKKQAIRDLKESVKRGYKDADAIESDSEFQTLKTEPEFQKLVAELRK